MSINDLVAFATGVRFAIDAIEMIETDDKLAARIGVGRGEKWLEVQRTYRLAAGKIAQVAIDTHPASRFRHTMTMRRVKG